MALPHHLTITGSGFDAGEFFYGCNADITDGPPGSGSRGLAPGEDALSVNFNRAAFALAENDEYLYGKVTRDIGLPVVAEYVCGGGINQIDIDPSGAALGDINFTGTIYLGESGWTGQERRDQLFQILDENYQEVSVDGNEVVVAAILGGNSLGDGFVNTLTTLGLSESLPTGIYKIGYYEGTTLEDLPPWAFTHAGLRGLEEVSGELKEHKARVEIGEVTLSAPFSSSITIDPTSGGGGNYDLSSAGFVYLGGSDYSGGGAEEAGFLFQILNEDYSPVIRDGTYIYVASTTPALGSGFYNGGLVSLNVNYNIPAGTYRLIVARDDNVAELKDDALVKGLSRYSHRHPSYEAFTATLSDGTNSTGGDINGINAINKLSDYTYGGLFGIKRGLYEWTSIAAISEHATVIGETLQWGATEASNSTTLYNTGAGLKTISGRYENVFLAAKGTGRLNLYNCTLRNVRLSPHCGYFGYSVNWVGGTLEYTATGSGTPTTPAASFSSTAEGVVEDVYFKATDSSANYVVDIQSQQTLVFRKCTFDASAVPGCHGIRAQNSNARVTFEDCTFIGSDGGYCVYSTVSSGSGYYRFVGCTFDNDYGYLVKSPMAMRFDKCLYVTGDLHRGGAITAVNTSTDTFTLAGDHSALGSGDVIRVVGSTGNDGYWTVASTSGTGPTDITVSEDVTDATADGTLQYGGYVPIFSLANGAITEATFVINDSNIFRNSDKLPVIEFGGDDRSYGTGSMHVDGVRIFGSFSVTPTATFLALYGRNSDSYTASYRDIILHGLPEPEISRGFSTGLASEAAWLEVYGNTLLDRSYCSCKDLIVRCASNTAVDGVTDYGSIFHSTNAVIDGLTLDADAEDTGTTGSTGYSTGLMKLTYSTVNRFEYAPSNPFHCEGTLGLFVLGESSVIAGGELHKIGTISGSVASWFSMGYAASVRDLYANIAAHLTTTKICNNGGTSYVTFSNNTFRSFGSALNTGGALITVGTHGKIVNNTIFIKRDTNLCVSASSDSIVDGNIFAYNGGGGTPSVSVGAGGVDGDNVKST